MINMVPVFMMQQQVLRQQREHAERQRQAQLRQAQLKREEKEEYQTKAKNTSSIIFYPRKEFS